MPALSGSKRVILGGLGIAIAASVSAAYLWAFQRRSKRKASNSRNRSVIKEENTEENNCCGSETEEEEVRLDCSRMPVKRGGRKDYRREAAARKEKDIAAANGSCSASKDTTNEEEKQKLNSPKKDLFAIERHEVISWPEEVEKAERQARELAQRFAQQCGVEKNTNSNTTHYGYSTTSPADTGNIQYNTSTAYPYHSSTVSQKPSANMRRYFKEEEPVVYPSSGPCDPEEEELSRALAQRQYASMALSHQRQHMQHMGMMGQQQHQAQVSPGSVSSMCSSGKRSAPVDSPSLNSDGQSEASQDSGRGGSTGLCSVMSPVEEEAANDPIEPPPIYEFEVPQSIVGLIIGKKGVVINELTDRSGAFILIRPHHYKDNFKICTIEGTRDQINKCLRLIRRRFPPSRFPDLSLNPLLPTPPLGSPASAMWGSMIQCLIRRRFPLSCFSDLSLNPLLPTPTLDSPASALWDSMIQLSLPEAVGCETVLSSMVDPGHLFLQQPTHPTFPSLARLDHFLLTVYAQPDTVPLLPRPIEVGVICVAPVLDGWYRALTMAYYEDVDDVLLRFVDYGGYARLPSADLRQIRSDFMSLPFQATECYLASVKPIDEEEGWCGEASVLTEECCRGKMLEARVISHAPDGLPRVELFLSNDEQPMQLNSLLVESGFAKWAENETTPPPVEINRSSITVA